MMLSKRMMLILPAVILVICALAVIADTSDAEVRDNIRVFVEMEDASHDPKDPSSSYYETTVNGVSSVRQAVDLALAQLNLSALTLDNRGNIATVGGITPDEGEYWVIHQWLPLGTPGWGEIDFSSAHEGKFLSGCSICIHMSSIEIVNNHARYTLPEFQPKSYGYVFIRFVTEYNNPKKEVQEAFTEEMRLEGFWLKGYGSSLGEVIQNAMESNNFEFDAYSGTDSGGNNLLFWINTMFGLETVTYDSGAYGYWIQYTYVDNCWDYNSWTLGYYDPAVYSYVGMFYAISEMGGNPDLGEEPDVDNMVVIKRYNTISFVSESETIGIQTVEYGDYADLNSVTTPTPPYGHRFIGWDYDNSPIKNNLVINALFEKIGDERPKVCYYSEGTLIYTEYVTYASAATYGGTPQKKSTETYEYKFTGWDKDLSCVTSDIDTNAVFAETFREYAVTFYDWNNEVISKTTAHYDCAIPCPQDPTRESSTKYTYTFLGWSSTYGGYVPADTEHIKGTTLCYAYYLKNDREYKISFFDSDSKISEVECKYGSILDNSLAATLMEGYVLKFFNDKGLTDPLSLECEILGDMSIYTSKTPGKCTINESSALITIDKSKMSEMPTESGSVKIADVSQISSVNTVGFDSGTIKSILSSFDKDDVFRICLPKGTLIIPYDSLKNMVESNTDGLSASSTLNVNGSQSATSTDAVVSYTISSGRMTSSINKLLSDYYEISAYNISSKINGISVTDISEYGKVSVSLPASETSNNVVHINDEMKLQILEYQKSGNTLIFDVCDLGLFCTCSDTEPAPGEIILDPIGTIEYENFKTGIRITRISGDSDGLYFVPQTYDGHDVLSITSSSFGGLKDAKIVVLPITLKNFEWNGAIGTVTQMIFLGDFPNFSGTRPSSVMIYASSEATGWTGFDCETLDIYEYIGDGFAFRYYAIEDEATILKWEYGSRIVIPESVMADGKICTMSYVGSYAFSESNVKTMVIASSIVYIMDGAFYDSDLSKITFSSGTSSLKYIGERAFANTAVVNHDLPYSLVYIGYEAYRNCTKLTQIYLPDNLSIIKEGAYSNCSDVTKIGLNASLTSIPARCFEFCSGLDHVEFGNDVSYIGKNAFSKCTSLVDVNLKNVEEVGDNAFYQCERLDYIVFGSKLKKLGTDSFGECGLNEGVDAYCEKPEGLESAFNDFSSVNLFVRSSVADSWSDYSYSLLDEPEDKDDSFDWQPVVITIMVAAIIAMFIASLYVRKKMF